MFQFKTVRHFGGFKSLGSVGAVVLGTDGNVSVYTSFFYLVKKRHAGNPCQLTVAIDNVN